MDDALKKRLLGAAVLVSLAVIFVPMLLEDEPVIETGIYKTNIPGQPDKPFPPSALPGEQQVLSLPPEERVKPLVAPEAPIESKPAVQPVEQTPEQESVVKAGKPASQPKPLAKPRVGLSAWVIQVGSFSRKQNADALVESLRKEKFSAFIEQTELNSKTLYRVRVGPEISRDKAEQMLARLNEVVKPMKLTGKLKSYP